MRNTRESDDACSSAVRSPAWGGPRNFHALISDERRTIARRTRDKASFEAEFDSLTTSHRQLHPFTPLGNGPSERLGVEVGQRCALRRCGCARGSKAKYAGKMNVAFVDCSHLMLTRISLPQPSAWQLPRRISVLTRISKARILFIVWSSLPANRSAIDNGHQPAFKARQARPRRRAAKPQPLHHSAAWGNLHREHSDNRPDFQSFLNGGQSRSGGPGVAAKRTVIAPSDGSHHVRQLAGSNAVQDHGEKHSDERRLRTLRPLMAGPESSASATG